MVPVISIDNLLKPFGAGPCNRSPAELNVEPCAAHKKDDVVALYSTVAPAWGQTDEKATKLDAVFPVAVRITIKPLFATKVLTDFNSESKLTVKPEDVPGLFTMLGAPLSSLEHALAKQATQAMEIGPARVDKNSPRFISI